MRYLHFRFITSCERGAALITALLIMLALMVVGVSAARTALHAEKSARGERDRQIAFHAAEAALADAERDIEGGSDPGSARATLFAPDSAHGFAAGCGEAPNPNVGLCMCSDASDTPAWQAADLASGGEQPARSVEYGQFTGARMPVGVPALPQRLPRYIIELVPLARAGDDAARPTGNFYRVTAIGFGASADTHVVLQSFYLKADGEGT